MKQNSFDSFLNTPSDKEKVFIDANLGNIENLNSTNKQSTLLSGKNMKNYAFAKQCRTKQKFSNQSIKLSECDTKVDSDNISRANELNISDEILTFEKEDNLFCEEELDNSSLNSVSREQPKKVIDGSKYKTEMCKNW